MSDRILRGFAHVYGDDVDTDRIIAGKHTKTLALADLGAHALEDLDPSFRGRCAPGDFIVGGENFGCGSSREQAPLALLAVQVGAVIARSCARIFFRNAVNVGLPVLIVPDLEIEGGARLAVDLAQGIIDDESASRRFHAAKMPPVMLAILAAGGLVPYLRANGGYGV